jgi:2-hydroxy-3-keto-5-methylthiopentenyl-1-phosphate phosphatase
MDQLDIIGDCASLSNKLFSSRKLAHYVCENQGQVLAFEVFPDLYDKLRVCNTRQG